ncbi:hypothetical protein N7467_000543 [Penicillium canescens]|nr:hypothetical protein N7467_000543 [Penicillium canescens]
MTTPRRSQHSKTIFFKDVSDESHGACTIAARLPPDVLLLILDEVQNTQDRVRLLQVCRTWNVALTFNIYPSTDLAFGEKFEPFVYAVQKPRVNHSKAGQEPTQSLQEILPSSIETLFLAKFDIVEYEMVPSQLRRLLNVHAQRCPGLRRIILKLNQMEGITGEDNCFKRRIPQDSEDAFDGVRSICQTRVRNST